MKTTWLIGCVCKSGDTFSLAVLIDRGLDLQVRRCSEHFLVECGVMPATTVGCFFSHPLPTLSLFSSQGLVKSENRIVGADDGEGTPVPIPNTAVKLTRADNTWLEAAR